MDAAIGNMMTAINNYCSVRQNIPSSDIVTIAGNGSTTGGYTTGGSTGSTSGGYTNQPPVVSQTPITMYLPSEYLGCWKDAATRALPDRLDVRGFSDCEQAARSRGVPVFGVQYGGECWVSQNMNDYKRYERLPEDKCSMKDQNQHLAGGDYANRVYAVRSMQN